MELTIMNESASIIRYSSFQRRMKMKNKAIHASLFHTQEFWNVKY